MWNYYLDEFGCVIVQLFLLQVYLGEQYVNNLTLSDVTFLVEGRKLFPAIFISALFIYLSFVAY